MTWAIHEGDCVEQMRKIDEASIDAIVCDPPYGIGFMGKEWDGQAIAEAAAADRASRKDLGPESASRPGRASPRSSSAFGNEAIIAGPVRGGADFQGWCLLWATEALRILKPGGHLLAFGGTRTYHRLACAVEDAGFDIRDSPIWLYGSGFPKSLDVSKAIDKAAGVEREIVGRKADPRYLSGATETSGAPMGSIDPRPNSVENYEKAGMVTAPATPEAAQWEGWGTALKPSHEPIVVGRKPLSGTVAANVLEHGTGGLNIDGCRVGTSKDVPASPSAGGQHGKFSPIGSERDGTSGFDPETGRWPPNVVLSPEAAQELDEEAGESTSRIGQPREGQNGDGWGMTATGAEYDDQGGPSRFFYCAKSSRAERNAGLDGFEEQERVNGNKWTDQDYRVARGERTPGRESGPRRNAHPTVKPIDLMRWLVRLVTPPGGTVLDPFTGSGTTGCAAVLEGFNFIGIEREAEYVGIAKARIDWWADKEGDTADILSVGTQSDRIQRDHQERGQMALLGEAE